MTMRTFDRLPQYDERSKRFGINQLLFNQHPRSFTWRCSAYLDQGSEGACVGFAWTHERAARPQEFPNVTNEDALSVYHEAQKIDEWPGENYDGTSVLAGAKAAQQLGWLKEYRWAFDLTEVLLSIGYRGPGVFGINWWTGMFKPDSEGFLRPTGSIAGGHAILGNKTHIIWQPNTTTEQKRSDQWVNFIDRNKSYIGLHNSWGKSWGVEGNARISLADAEKLLHDQGEFCIPTRS